MGMWLISTRYKVHFFLGGSRSPIFVRLVSTSAPSPFVFPPSLPFISPLLPQRAGHPPSSRSTRSLDSHSLSHSQPAMSSSEQNREKKDNKSVHRRARGGVCLQVFFVFSCFLS